MTVFGTNILEGKVAYVAGGTRGFNLAIAKRYAEQGARVVVMSRDEDRCASAAQEIRDSGGEALGLPADVRDYDRVAETMQETADAFGGIDIVVAGQAGNFYAPALGMSANAFKSVVDIDLLGTFNLYRASFEHLTRPGASLIAITAPEAVKPLPFQSHVCSAKSAVNMLTKVLAIEWGPAGVRVNGISPGPIENSWGMDNVIATNPGIKERITQGVPLRRWGTHDDIADAALFLASDAASYINGTILDVDGGVTIKSTGPEDGDAVDFDEHPRVKGPGRGAR
ncbi:oxidoreductase, short chain dehydrogenase/reductase family protein [Aeromicrobium marinum DSM 15272]|uniref:Oxidoreductase, short chain dehydrogenase/reductase family protein n=1 Tax=Aeromicrobium marinum DSM 15272 TaxID=585531 RepID=E2SEL6_9ACTN|nr:SDR family oxidoreductase [Aeromicrobium marinum]EFQ82313.1 oxidoreductase, short chain dehydrogenase/reductase family protein [Aeromicrobium marinum DSM 15272]